MLFCILRFISVTAQWWFSFSSFQRIFHYFKTMALYKSLLLITLFCYIKHNAVAGSLNTIFYNYTTNMTCTSTELQSGVIRPITLISCSILCTESDRTCLGFGHSSNKCELCYGCEQSSSPHSINSNHITFSVDFTQELDKGMYCSLSKFSFILLAAIDVWLL